MRVFGDHVRIADPRVIARELERQLNELAAHPACLARHAALVAVFLDASELAQGFADAESASKGIDTRGIISDVAMALLVGIARQIDASWRTGFTHVPRIPRALGVLRMLPLPDVVTLHHAEGHAYYAVYPEAYLQAATEAITQRPGPRHVIGIRSIGTGLAAIVAAVTDSPLPATVRPRGEPYRRSLEISDTLAAEWADDASATIAIVDEGPGMSGSSFGAVADALEDRGIHRIECFPSHAGELGATASARHRERWPRLARHVVDADELLVRTEVLSGWIADLVGPLLGPLEDLSAGAWRALRFRDPASWPPSVTFQERRKWLARTSSASWLARFVGVGRQGLHALSRARGLHAAGFCPDVAGLCHGFLIERWFDDAVPLDPRVFDRAYLIVHVARYLSLRACSFARREPGATLEQLVDMARENTACALGGRPAARLDRYRSRLAALQAVVRPIEIDGRMHVWEWIVRANGNLMKTDALDHHASHDLVGCQDLTWDLAGAAVELALSPLEQQRLAAVVEAVTGRAHDPELLCLMRVCYLAFQLGRHALAIDTAEPAEGVRLSTIVERYASLLSQALG